MGGKATVRVCTVLVVLLLLAFFPSGIVSPVLADPGKMTWSVVDTPAPGKEDNVVVPGCEINAIAIGNDGRTLYVVDTPNRKLYKSEDGGATWKDVSDRLFEAAGAAVHIWNVVMAPDDVSFVVVVTDYDAVTQGPKRVFISKDGGQNWGAVDSGLTLAANEFIGCLDVSFKYGQYRDIAIGTRNGGAGGNVLVLPAEVTAPAWRSQNLTGTGAGDVVAVRFSPSYTADWGIIAVAANTNGTYINLGKRDTVAGTTTWNNAAGYTGYPVCLRASGETQYPKIADVINADLELPSDFLAVTVPGDSPRRRYYVGINTTGNLGYLYRVTNTSVSNITPPASPPGKGIFSIAYFGDYRDGELLAGEIIPYTAGRVRVWRTSSPTYLSPSWRPSQPDYGSPTGGFVTGYANAVVAWHPDGRRAYCGTSSAALNKGGTSIADPNMWPGALLTVTTPGDESAFSVSPCSEWYEMQLSLTEKRLNSTLAEHWTQLSLIDSNINRLCDVAALNVPEPKPGEEAVADYEILYLASLSGNSSYSIWRSTGLPPGQKWERVMWLPSHNGDKGVLLRVRQPHYEDKARSRVVIYGEVEWREVWYSSNEGQTWTLISGDMDMDIVDLAVARDHTFYVLSSVAVYRHVRSGTTWDVGKVYTDFSRNHTIAVPLYRSEETEVKEEWVIVGEAGPPDGYGRVAYADFAQPVAKFLPRIEERKPVPIEGNVHVITDDRFEGNRTIYAASHDTGDNTGKVYRWVIGKSNEWEELGPPNSAFYGLAMRNDVLYGAWGKDELIDIPGDYQGGVDRTLYARAPVPPPPEWDYLIEGLPISGMVRFTGEPSSLKISSDKYNWLWAIDDRPYNWQNQQGCLWVYTDIFARVGPWTVLPASGDVLACDPVSGLAKQIDFRWRQLDYAAVYEMQIAKDKEFTIRVLVNEDIVPEDQLSPAVFFPSGGYITVPASEIALPGTLECGHQYYWRVRARGATTGEKVRSPWSATMYFTTKVGVPVHNRYLSPVLLSPKSGAGDVGLSPAFSWAPLPEVVKYEFVLARDPELKQVLVRKKVADTAFKYEGELSPGATYFWQVKGVEPFTTEPSAVATFTVARAKAEPIARPGEPVGILTWAGIAIYTILAAVVMVFIRARSARGRTDEQGEQSQFLE